MACLFQITFNHFQIIFADFLFFLDAKRADQFANFLRFLLCIVHLSGSGFDFQEVPHIGFIHLVKIDEKFLSFKFDQKTQAVFFDLDLRIRF